MHDIFLKKLSCEGHANILSILYTMLIFIYRSEKKKLDIKKVHFAIKSMFFVIK